MLLNVYWIKSRCLQFYYKLIALNWIHLKSNKSQSQTKLLRKPITEHGVYCFWSARYPLPSGLEEAAQSSLPKREFVTSRQSSIANLLINEQTFAELAYLCIVLSRWRPHFGPIISRRRLTPSPINNVHWDTFRSKTWYKCARDSLFWRIKNGQRRREDGPTGGRKRRGRRQSGRLERDGQNIRKWRECAGSGCNREPDALYDSDDFNNRPEIERVTVLNVLETEIAGWISSSSSQDIRWWLFAQINFPRGIFSSLAQSQPYLRCKLLL